MKRLLLLVLVLGIGACLVGCPATKSTPPKDKAPVVDKTKPPTPGVAPGPSKNEPSTPAPTKGEPSPGGASTTPPTKVEPAKDKPTSPDPPKKP